MLKSLKVDKMGQFRFETIVASTITFEYFIDADSLEEALEQLQNGEHRDDGVILDEDINWGSEVITVEEEID
jgi:hypothetical protein